MDDGISMAEKMWRLPALVVPSPRCSRPAGSAKPNRYGPRRGVRRVVAGPRSAWQRLRHHPGSEPALPISTGRAC